MNADELADLLPFGPLPPREVPDDAPPLRDVIDDDFPLELDEDYWNALLPEDDYEPLPEYGDFWTEQDAA
jgi:hypothetical protein